MAFSSFMCRPILEDDGRWSDGQSSFDVCRRTRLNFGPLESLDVQLGILPDRVPFGDARPTYVHKRKRKKNTDINILWANRVKRFKFTKTDFVCIEGVLLGTNVAHSRTDDLQRWPVSSVQQLKLVDDEQVDILNILPLLPTARQDVPMLRNGDQDVGIRQKQRRNGLHRFSLT